MPCSPSRGFGGWAAEREKVEYFRAATTSQVERTAASDVRRGDRQDRFATSRTSCRSASTADGRTHVFLYLVNRKTPVDFRAFLHRHAELLRALPEWELRLLVPRHLLKAAAALSRRPRARNWRRRLRLDDVDELRWYFRQQDQVDRGGAPEDFQRFRRACRAFRAPRFHALYRLWKKNGDEPVHATVSPVLEDKIARRRGQVTSACAASCLCRISHPWLAPRSPAIVRKEGGTQTSGGVFPLLGARRGAVRQRARAAHAARRGVPQVVEREGVAGTRRSRGVLCRAWRAPVAARQQ